MEYKCVEAVFPEMNGPALFQLSVTPMGARLRSAFIFRALGRVAVPHMPLVRTATVYRALDTLMMAVPGCRSKCGTGQVSQHGMDILPPTRADR